jgi:hypothetical protein
MKIFDADHLGKPIVGEAKQRAVRDETHFMGFWAQATLTTILQPSTCVGIRFYNAGGLQPADRQMIAVGVTEDGSELNQRKGRGYFISAARATTDSDQKITKAKARAAMLQLEEDRTPDEKMPVRFTSYFSRAMLEQLLAPKGDAPVLGLQLYRLPLEGSIFHSHVAISSDGNLALTEQGAADKPSHILSDQPCPGGVCAVVAPEEAEVSKRLADPASIDEVSGLDSTKYLLIWHQG